MTFDQRRLARLDTHFQQYVDDGRLAGWQLLVGQHGEVAHSGVYGMADEEAARPVQDDTLWRIYSMTKPLTTVAAMALWERGCFELTNEVSRWIPSFAGTQVFAGGSNTKALTTPAVEPVRMWHLLTHTSGLTYGFLQLGPVDSLYRSRGFDVGIAPGLDLAAVCDELAALPLAFQPGTAWGYGHSTDVLGRVIEVITGKRLDAALAELVLDPLGMTETTFHVTGPDVQRLAAVYAVSGGQRVRYDALGDKVLSPRPADEGGGGLVSSARDYWRFTQMLLGRGELDGVRVLAPRTVGLMTRNQLPGGADLGALNSGGFAETVFDGIGFGYGFAVMMDPVPSRSAGSVGEHYWGGLASTFFWVDPSTGVAATFFTQLVPSSTYPVRAQLRQLVYSALLD